MNKKKRIKTIIIFLCFMLFGGITVGMANEEFPLREKYPNVPYITTEDLAAQYDDIIIIDVRSTFEFNVVHIEKALHKELAKATFISDVEAVRAKDGEVKIAFYCNGHTCAKSYKATKKAIEAGFKNVYAYDAGIFDWIQAYPEKGVLLGETPVSPEKIISKAAFNAKKLSFDDFKAKAMEPNTMIIDVRDPMQREKIPALDKIRNIPLDRLLGLLNKGQFKDKQLLIFDAVGKQVRWLQYYLENNGYSNYYFLKKGVLSSE